MLNKFNIYKIMYLVLPTSIIFSLAMLLSSCSNTLQDNQIGLSANQNSNSDSELNQEAELLYQKINEFLAKNKNCDVKDFEDVCINYIKNNSSSPKLMSKQQFDKKSKNKIILYRGFERENAKQYAKEFREGKIFIGKNVDNVRGNGIYTTANYECAKLFTNDHKAENIVTMFLNNNKHILEIEKLTKLKEIMATNHPDEFKDYLSEYAKGNYQFVPLNKLANTYLIKECVPDFDSSRLDDLNAEETANLLQELIPEDKLADTDWLEKIVEKVKKDPEYETLKNEPKYFTDNKVALFFNDGLLTKLLGYNVLHTDEYDEELKVDIAEYLIVDSGVLTICTDE